VEEKEYLFLKARFKHILKKYKLEYMHEDVLHEFVVKRLEGKRKRQSLDFFVVDYLRNLTKSRRKGHEHLTSALFIDYNIYYYDRGKHY